MLGPYGTSHTRAYRASRNDDSREEVDVIQFAIDSLEALYALRAHDDPLCPDVLDDEVADLTDSIMMADITD